MSLIELEPIWAVHLFCDWYSQDGEAMTQEECVDQFITRWCKSPECWQANLKIGTLEGIEELDGELYLHSCGFYKHGKYDHLFNLERHPDAPRTFQELRQYLMKGGKIVFGWGDRGATSCVIAHLPRGDTCWMDNSVWSIVLNLDKHCPGWETHLGLKKYSSYFEELRNLDGSYHMDKLARKRFDAMADASATMLNYDPETEQFLDKTTCQPVKLDLSSLETIMCVSFTPKTIVKLEGSGNTLRKYLMIDSS